MTATAVLTKFSAKPWVVPEPEAASPPGVSILEIPDTGCGGDLEELPCLVLDPDLWFAESPADLERAKTYCAGCPIRAECLAGALDRREPWGVWGGEILSQGVVIGLKRPRGRPRKS